MGTVRGGRRGARFGNAPSFRVLRPFSIDCDHDDSRETIWRKVETIFCPYNPNSRSVSRMTAICSWRFWFARPKRVETVGS